jgi:ferric-dicitrate binding protein FerR (iron transport regulator)
MDNINRHLRISKLIAKSVGGDIGKESREELDSWLNESPENLELFNKIKEDKNFKEWEDIYYRFGEKQSWKKMEPKLKKGRSRNIWTIAAKFAAVMLLPLAIYLLFQLEKQQEVIEQPATVVQFEPGQPKALLLLDNGESLELENRDTLVNLNAGSTNIRIVDNKIEYTNRLKRTYKTQYNTIQIPHRGEFFLVLSDGTKVWLNASTTMRYPVSFDDETREVELTGEAYFEVHPDAEKPFIVKTNSVKVEVLGTHFNVKAYPDDALSQTTLSQGKVKVTSEDKELVLLPDQQANYILEGNQLSVKNVDASVFTSWKDGKFMYVDESISYILNDLRKWYNFEDLYEDESLKRVRFSVNVNRYENLNEFLRIIEATGKMKFKIEGEKIIIYN